MMGHSTDSHATGVAVTHQRGRYRSALAGGLLLVGVLAMAGEPSGHRFTVGQVHPYLYQLTDTTSWTSAGDTLRFTTRQAWTFSLKTVSVTADQAELEAVIRTLGAKHEGPGVKLFAKSNQDLKDNADPRLSNLLAQVGVPLTLVVKPSTGQVGEVRGSEKIVETICNRNPGPPGQPSPLKAQARLAFGGPALARRWSEILLTPGSGSQTVELAAPATGSVIRTWNGTTYTLSLDPQGPPVAVELSAEPRPLRLTLTRLSGSGQVEMQAGLVDRASCRMEFTVAGTALGQAVEQRHLLEWSVGRLGLEPAAKAAEKTVEEAGSPTEAPK